ncbi:Polyamine oxidase [Choanephora cucurbitarum]|uniref:Polyamine oxidase n=1 Tax=Choanephora cucurbitarum TaxID=101091 RepID=A0A1C7N6W6_9FUNG|nr:Polyamine oxidase [Choanephora cucurbitarum]
MYLEYVFLALICLIKVVELKVLETEVVILGAGASGISAAQTLFKKGIHDFILVDAQSFIGGRVQHAAFGRNTVELGANWIYGKGKNPIHALALRHGLQTTPNDKNNLVYFDDSGFLSDQAEGVQTSESFEVVKAKLVGYAEKRMKHNQVDLSSRSALSLIGWQPDTPLKAAVEYFNIDWEFSEPAEMCSLDYATGTADAVSGSFPLGNEFVIDKRGFNHILQEESKTFLEKNDSRLMLNTTVTKVIYHDHGVTVITSNGDRIVSKYAICTFSQTAHLLVQQFALYASNVTRHGGHYTVWQNLNAPGYLFKASDNVLMVTTTDKASQRIERMADTQVQKEIMAVLQRMFPSTPIEAPTDILIPRWHQNPLFHGSYSNWPIGASKKHHLNMRAPLYNRLWFAGEAMSADYYGYLHGAWLEGQSVAESILECLTKNQCPVYEQHEYVTGCELENKPRFFRQSLL